jgi:glycosyltransferase involved in cell wall biosynthesis
MVIVGQPINESQYKVANILSTPFVSVCVPTFNRPESLERLLRVICSLTYGNLDIFISDNCSTDPKVESVCRFFAMRDSRIRYFRQAANIGMVANHNFVFRQAKGIYAVTLHDDDDIPPNYIECLVNILLSDVHAVLCGSACERYFEGRLWYNYDCFDNSNLDKISRLKQIVAFAFTDPNGFEHMIYGVFKGLGATPHSFADFRVGPPAVGFEQNAGTPDLLTCPFEFLDDLLTKLTFPFGQINDKLFDTHDDLLGD